ncbi:trimeric intracellular cation channel family protein [Aurantiacibacter poecillastricola]|uniref:trimeric intracellular cation channel family protein n=1 Tax=Aurantiacibacter poecillastricola TaxID=3064385 RepID=UPI0027400204|nr:trimeric intracellular cation channel family protein [Aurantiacibacter sp. 219JJ12-13]MDP5263283.1 trimeric intracellular cation channel family protein [Aurantiacibacter sp. 219JJ12-13]
MFENSIIVLDWLGIVVFTVSGALVASRNQMDVIGFILLGTVTGIGGGTIRDLLLDAHPVFWIERPQYLAVCIGVAITVFFTAHLAASRYKMILWLDAIGLTLFATGGTEKAMALGEGGLVAVTMGVITACFGGIIRDVIGREDSIIFSHEIYVTAAVLAALTYVGLHALGAPRELSIALAFAAGFGLRAGALALGWSLPRYKPRPPDF